MKRIAIIPARGGSKRIPRKNIKDFFGKPIIVYSIEAALKSELFDVVMVSTDDSEIAKISKGFGASVPFLRSANNSDDYAGTPDVLVEVINEYESINKRFSCGCCIYPTAPFLSTNKLKDSFSLFNDQVYDTVFPVVQFSSSIQRALRVDAEGRVSMLHPENLEKRSQDLEATYHDAGQFYWFRPEKIVSTKQLWTDNSGTIVYPSTEVQDIDSPEDWELAKMKYSLVRDLKH